MRTCFVYTRVSDIKLKDETQRRQDIERQVSLLVPLAEKWVMNRPVEEHDWSVDVGRDDGISASHLSKKERPAFKQLLDGVRKGEVKAVFVEDTTRLARDLVEFVLVWRLFEQNKVVLYCHLDGRELNLSDSKEKLLKRIMVAIEESKEDDRSLKISSGMKFAASKLENACVSCNEVHLGRHPKSCRCDTCNKKKRDSFNGV